jgi:hypothetical protein
LSEINALPSDAFSNLKMSKAHTKRTRAKPGSRSGGRFFHIEVRPARDFVSFRVQDIGSPGGVERLAGQRANGSWDTQKWLIEKTHAHIENGRLVADSLEAEKVLASLSSVPVQVGGDRFKAKPKRDIPESEKPTPAMHRAQMQNIKKARAAVRKRQKSATAQPRASKSRRTK